MRENNLIQRILKKFEEKYKKIKENTKINKDIFPNSENIMHLQNSSNAHMQNSADKVPKLYSEKFHKQNKKVINTDSQREKRQEKKIYKGKEKREKEKREKEKDEAKKLSSVYFKQIPFAPALSSIGKSAPKAEIITKYQERNRDNKKEEKYKKEENTNIINKIESKEKNTIQENRIEKLVKIHEKHISFDCTSLVNSISTGVLQK